MRQRIAVDLLGKEPARAFIAQAVSFPGVELLGLEPAAKTNHWQESLFTRAFFATPRNPEAYQHMLDALVKINEWYRDNGWKKFRVYRGARYQAEPAAEEVWQTIPALALRRKGDCEDLSAARAAEIGGRAILVDKGPKPNGGTLYHVIVKKGSRREDPSRKLGMKG